MFRDNKDRVWRLEKSGIYLRLGLFVDPKAAAARRSATGTDKTRQYEVWRVYLSVRLPSLHKRFLHYSLLERL